MAAWAVAHLVPIFFCSIALVAVVGIGGLLLSANEMAAYKRLWARPCLRALRIPLHVKGTPYVSFPPFPKKDRGGKGDMRRKRLERYQEWYLRTHNDPNN